MNDDEFKEWVIDKLNELSERIARIETNWNWIKKLCWIMIAALCTKLGIDIIQSV